MLNIVRNDITKVKADAIVNSANPKPVIGGGADAAIYEAAGEELLLAERRKIGEIKPGEAKVTAAFGLNADFIIHTVGPVWKDGESGEFETLTACYRNSLDTALDLGCKSVAFPLISTGVYGFPKDKALRIAVDTISAFLSENEMEVTIAVFDQTAFRVSEELLKSVESFISDRLGVPEFIDDSYVSEKRQLHNYSLNRRNAPDDEDYLICASTGPEPEKKPKGLKKPSIIDRPEKKAAVAGKKPLFSLATPTEESIDDFIKKAGETFPDRLMRYIDEKGLSDTQVYKRANIDRKLFSKIRCTPNYKPKRKTAVALAVAMELSLDETLDLLKSAGFTLSQSSNFDLIIEYCIENKMYNIFDINLLLFKYGEETLGS